MTDEKKAFINGYVTAVLDMTGEGSWRPDKLIKRYTWREYKQAGIDAEDIAYMKENAE